MAYPEDDIERLQNEVNQLRKLVLKLATAMRDDDVGTWDLVDALETIMKELGYEQQPIQDATLRRGRVPPRKVLRRRAS